VNSTVKTISNSSNYQTGADRHRPNSTIHRKGHLLDGGGLTSRGLCHNPWVSPVHTRGVKRDVNRAPNAAGLLDSNDGAFCYKRMHSFEEHDIGSHIDEQIQMRNRDLHIMEAKVPADRNNKHIVLKNTVRSRSPNGIN
jgi:hypothetical protein